MDSSAASEDRGFCKLPEIPPEEPGNGTDTFQVPRTSISPLDPQGFSGQEQNSLFFCGGHSGAQKFMEN